LENRKARCFEYNQKGMVSLIQIHNQYEVFSIVGKADIDKHQRKLKVKEISFILGGEAQQVDLSQNGRRRCILLSSRLLSLQLYSLVDIDVDVYVASSRMEI
jgi:hypothetical protein